MCVCLSLSLTCRAPGAGAAVVEVPEGGPVAVVGPAHQAVAAVLVAVAVTLAGPARPLRDAAGVVLAVAALTWASSSQLEVPNQQRSLNKLPPELRHINFVDKHQTEHANQHQNVQKKCACNAYMF